MKRIIAAIVFTSAFIITCEGLVKLAEKLDEWAEE